MRFGVDIDDVVSATYDALALGRDWPWIYADTALLYGDEVAEEVKRRVYAETGGPVELAHRARTFRMLG